jgi:hypothetical protein
MHVYKFKVTFEDQDNFFREIEIKATQTFEDLHNLLLECGDFEGQELASFYLCDSQWKKMQEITLFDMNIEDDDEKTRNAQKKHIFTMADTRLKDLINDPHQKIIYVYDYLEMWTFHIELFKILESDDKINYPRIVKSAGKIIKKMKEIPADINFEEEDMGREFEDTLAAEDREFLSDDSSFLSEEYFDER